MNAPADKPDLSQLSALSDALAAVVEQVGRSTVAIRGRRGATASGAVWRPGIVVTAAHVFRRAPTTLSVVLPDASSAEATLAGIDPSTDIAVFRLAGSSPPSVDSADASDVRAGHLAIAVGRSQHAELTSSFGMVNRSAGAWQTWLGGRVDQLIRLDGGIHDGLSGAPVATAAGRVFGMATAALSRSYGIVVPTSTINSVVDVLLSKGHVARAYLGISAQPVEVAGVGPAAAGEAATGLLISAIAPDGPAAKAGLLVGDIIVSVAGERTSALHLLRHSLAGHIGQSVPVSLIRGGAVQELQVVVGAWPTEHRSC